PLVLASGAGAIGNRTIGSSALGGMLIGTLVGVLVIPGLYYVFATMIEGRKFMNDEDVEPISEAYVRRVEEEVATKEVIRTLNARVKDLLKRRKDQ
ncbi:MAG: hypothetical protein M3R08_10475, partial [Bacteroidota bacterium]|nr:hypothetical protein [Bacteroidota bacterium]